MLTRDRMPATAADLLRLLSEACAELVTETTTGELWSCSRAAQRALRIAAAARAELEDVQAELLAKGGSDTELQAGEGAVAAARAIESQLHRLIRGLRSTRGVTGVPLALSTAEIRAADTA